MMNKLEFHRYLCRRFRARKHYNTLPYCLKRATRIELAKLLGELGFNRGAEIGVSRGAYSLALCEANPQIELYCIDPWLDKLNRRTSWHDSVFSGAQIKLSDHNARFIRKTSMEALRHFDDGSLDFVYIDGNHGFDYCCPDIIYWSKKVRCGGIVAGHDYVNARAFGVIKAVDAYTHCHRIDPWYVTNELNPSFFWVNP